MYCKTYYNSPQLINSLCKNIHWYCLKFILVYSVTHSWFIHDLSCLKTLKNMKPIKNWKITWTAFVIVASGTCEQTCSSSAVSFQLLFGSKASCLASFDSASWLSSSLSSLFSSPEQINSEKVKFLSEKRHFTHWTFFIGFCLSPSFG